MKNEFLPFFFIAKRCTGTLKKLLQWHKFQDKINQTFTVIVRNNLYDSSLDFLMLQKFIKIHDENCSSFKIKLFISILLSTAYTT